MSVKNPGGSSSAGPPETWMQKEAGDDAKPLDGSDAVGRKHAKAAKATEGTLERRADGNAERWAPPETDEKGESAGDGFRADPEKLGRIDRAVLGAMWNQTALPILPGVSHFASLPLGQWSEVSLHQKAEDLPDGRQHRTRSFDLYLEEPVEVPTGSPFVSASVGPILESTLKCSIKSPKQPGDEAKKGFEKSDLPIDPEKVRTLPPGTEISLQGFGELGVTGTVAAGRTIAVGPLIIGAAVGPTDQRSKGAFFKFELRVGDTPGKVHIRIEHTPLTEHTRSLVATLGVEGNWDGVNAHLGQMAQRVAGAVENTVDDQAFNKTGFRAARTTTDVHSQPVVQTIDLDLNDPKDRETYQTLIQFKPDVPMNDQRGQRDLHASGVNIQLGPLGLHRSKSIYETDHERVRTLKGESLKLDQAQMDRKSGGLFQHKTHVTVRAQETRGSGGADGFLEVRLSRAGIKGKDLEGMRAFAASLGVKWEKPKDKADDDKKDDSESLDVFLTEKGVRKVAGLPAEEVLTVYAQQSDQYRKAKKPLALSNKANLAQALPLIRGWRNAAPSVQQAIQDQYRDAFKKAGFDTDIARASDELEKAEKVARFAASLSGSWGRKQFGQFTRELGGKELWPALATLTTLAGRKNVRVGKLEASSDAGNLAARAQATPGDGFARINGMMDPTLKTSDVDAVESDDDDGDDGDDDSD